MIVDEAKVVLVIVNAVDTTLVIASHGTVFQMLPTAGSVVIVTVSPGPQFEPASLAL